MTTKEAKKKTLVFKIEFEVDPEDLLTGDDFLEQLREVGRAEVVDVEVANGRVLVERES